MNSAESRSGGFFAALAGVVLVAAHVQVFGATVVRQFHQPAAPNVEASNISHIRCDGPTENRGEFYIYQYLNRPGYRAVVPGTWAIIGNYPNSQLAVQAACGTAQPQAALTGRWGWNAGCPEGGYGHGFTIGPVRADGTFSGQFDDVGTLAGRVQGNRIEFVRTGQWFGQNQQQRWVAVLTQAGMEQGMIERPTEKRPNCTFVAKRQ